LESKTMISRRCLLALPTAFFMLTGCATQHSEKEMNFSASALTKLSAAVDATVRYTQIPDGVNGAELLTLSAAEDPTLLEPFKTFKILVRREGRFSGVLVCEADGSAALLEDSGCTAKLDRHAWREKLTARCEFSLDLSALCQR
jgi:hypothetical protein